MKPMTIAIAALVCVPLGTALAQAVPTELSLSIDVDGPVEMHPARYDCGAAGIVTVTYVNAEPTQLAVVPVDGVDRVFSVAMSGSGARYVAGRYEWWLHHGEAILRDQMQVGDVPPVMTCTDAPSE